MPSNLGYAGGMNAGAAKATCDVDALLFMTHELTLDQDCLSHLIAALDRDPETGMVGPALSLIEDNTLWSLGGLITARGDVVHNKDASRVHLVQWLDGACLLVRESAFRACNGFDEDYFLYWEDVDISLKLSRYCRVKCVQEARAYQGTATAPLYLRVRNQILCWRKHAAHTALLMAVLTAVVKLLLTDIPSGSSEQIRARYLGVIHGFSGRLTDTSIMMLRARA
jgi:GT2 family glycosyltransferase